MKNLIEYYYGLININIINKNNIVEFEYNNNTYIFKEIYRKIEEIKEIYELLYNNNKYNQIILTKNNFPLVIYNNKQYILTQERNYKEENITISDILYKNNIKYYEKYKMISREKWFDLWIRKIDYIYYQRKHINKKYKILDQYLDYYIGLSENAISYYNNINKNEKDKRDIPTISHRRIYNLKKRDYYDINNIVLDHYTRDICEYIKYKFFYENIINEELENILDSINLSKYGWQLFYCRMVFPTYFLDMYEKIVNDKTPENNIILITKKTKKYELFLKKIYKIINKKTSIPSINWISS